MKYMFGTKKNTAQTSLEQKERQLEVREATLRANEHGLELRQKLVEEISSEQASLKTELLDSRLQATKDIVEFECTYHAGMEEKRIVLAKLDAEIAFKKTVLETTKDSSKELFETKLAATKESYESILKTKDEVIALFRDQIEILTAKLTEIKIDSVTLNAVMKTEETKK